MYVVNVNGVPTKDTFMMWGNTCLILILGVFLAVIFRAFIWNLKVG